MQSVFALLAGQLERRRTERGSDLFSVLLEQREQGAPLSDDEILGNMSTVLLAGNASVGHYFSNLIYALWRHPDQRRLLLGDLGKLPAAIEEGVRWDTSTHAFARQTLSEAAFDGVTIPADRRVVVFYAAANRDERAIENPDRFDIDRPKSRHFGWGSGPHICLGAQTARAMLRTILTVLLPALGEYELDLARSERIAHVMVRGFYKLPIRW
jgi:cytochrome P450